MQVNFLESGVSIIKPLFKNCQFSFSEKDVKDAYDTLQKFHENTGKSCICETRKISQTFDLDIIVPCYNVENQVENCIDSLITQKTKYNFRIILIDDGSTDKTGKIIDSYVYNPTIKIIHQKNRGHSGARNSGLNIIDAKYVMFVDSDDKLCSENAVQKLLDCAYQYNADIVEGGNFYLKNHKHHFPRN